MVRPSPRSAAQVQNLVLAAARELFAAQGYERTTTRDIAKRAAVTPSQLFAQFGTKAALFEQAAITPYADVVNAYVQRWDAVAHDDVNTVQLCRDIMIDLFDVFQSNAGLITALILAQEHSPELHAELRLSHDAVNRVLAPLERFTTEEAQRRGYFGPGFDTAATVRLNHGTVLAASVFGVFDDRAEGSPAGELARLLTDGFSPAARTRPAQPPSADDATPEVLLSARRRLLDAARESFRDAGYARTGTRTLAAAANTSESVIFRHFAGKQDLFEQSIVACWEDAVHREIAESAKRSITGRPVEDFAGEVLALVELFSGHRGHLLAMLETRSSNARSREALARTFAQLSTLLRERFTAAGSDPEDPTCPLLLCLIAGATVLDSWIFTGTRHPPDWTARQVTRLALHGVAHQN